MKNITWKCKHSGKGNKLEAINAFQRFCPDCRKKISALYVAGKTVERAIEIVVGKYN